MIWPPFTPFTVSIFNIRFEGTGVDVILITPVLVVSDIVFNEELTNSRGTGLLANPIEVCCPALPTNVNFILKIVAESGKL